MDVTSRVLEQQNQLPFTQRAWFEAEMPVKRFCLGIHRVGQQSTDARLLGNDQGAQDGVLQQAKTDSFALIVQVYGEPGQNYQRDGILTHPPPNALRGLYRVDLAHGQTEVTHHPLNNTLRITNHKGSRRTAGLSLARVMPQPFSERRFATIEGFETVMRGECLGSCELHFSAQIGRRAKRSASPGLSDSGRSNISMSA